MKRNKHSQRKQEVPRSPWFGVAVFLAVLIAVVSIGSYLLLRGPTEGPGQVVPVEGDVQVARMAIYGLDYEPSTITVKQGQKVRWIIDATNAQGCARTMYSRQLGVNQILQSGENVIEFTPTKTGTIPFSCTMGMSRGQFQVV